MAEARAGRAHRHNVARAVRRVFMSALLLLQTFESSKKNIVPSKNFYKLILEKIGIYGTGAEGL